MALLKTLIIALTAGACAGPVVGGASVYLSCAPQSARSGGLCSQLRSVIEASEPDLKITEISPEEAAPASAAAVRLWVEALNETRISAHLEWHGPDGAWQKGQSVSMDVMDARLNDAMLARFLGSLWTQSKIDF